MENRHKVANHYVAPSTPRQFEKTGHCHYGNSKIGDLGGHSLTVFEDLHELVQAKAYF